MRNLIAWAGLAILALGAGSTLAIYRLTDPRAPAGLPYSPVVAAPEAPRTAALPSASLFPRAVAPAPAAPVPAGAEPVIVHAGPGPIPGNPSQPPAVIQGPAPIPLPEDEAERTARLLEVRRQRIAGSLEAQNRRSSARLQRHAGGAPKRP